MRFPVGPSGEALVSDFQRAMVKHESDYKEDLAIFYTNNYKYVDVLAHYHPPEHSAASKFLTAFLRTVKLPSPPVPESGNFVVKSVKWPSWYFSRACKRSAHTLRITHCWLVFTKEHPQGRNKITFHRQQNGYFRMQLFNFGTRYN